MLVRRLLLVAAALMLLSALAAGLAERDPATTRGSATTAASALPPGRTVVRQIPADPGARTRIPVRRGDTLRLEVAGDLLDSVLIERLDRTEAIQPEKNARFEVLIDAPAGAYPIRLVDADRRIGTLQISP